MKLDYNRMKLNTCLRRRWTKTGRNSTRDLEGVKQRLINLPFARQIWRQNAALYKIKRKNNRNSASTLHLIQIPASILVNSNNDDIYQSMWGLIMVSSVHRSLSLRTDLDEAKWGGRVTILHQLRLTSNPGKAWTALTKFMQSYANWGNISRTWHKNSAPALYKAGSKAAYLTAQEERAFYLSPVPNLLKSLQTMSLSAARLMNRETAFKIGQTKK